MKGGESYLSLAIQVGQYYSPNSEILQKLSEVFTQIGTTSEDGETTAVNSEDFLL